jgi:CO/xanthine dehydrogenase Mo-binding subunit
MSKLSSGPSIKIYNLVSNWIIFDNNKVKILSGKVDIGQHITTTLSIIASRELDISIDKIEVLNLTTKKSPDEGFTAGSLSVSHSGTAVKAASITFRNLFIEHVLSKFNVEIDDLNIENGIAKILGTNQFFSYWDFAQLDNYNDIKITEFIQNRIVPINPKKQPIKNKTITNIVTGNHKFIQDLDFPNMMHARVLRPLNYFSKLKYIDNKLILNLKNNNINVLIKGSFIAIIGSDEFEVIKALNKLKHSCEWKNLENINNRNVFEMLSNNKKDSLLVKSGGEAFYEKIPDKHIYDDKNFITLNSEYTKPYIMHGSIGPSAACSIFQNNKLKIFTHSQGVYQTRGAICEALKVKEQDVEMIFMPSAGCYGHNGADDAAFEAGIISMTFPDKHILLKWTREDENCWEPYGSATLSKISGTLDLKGNIVYWSHETFADTFMTRPSKGGAHNFLSYKYINNDFQKRDQLPKTAPHMGIHRNLDPLYNFKKTRLVKNLVHNLPLRTSALRGLGAFGNILAIESFMNELAFTANIDPLTFRLNHLDDNRAKEVLINLKAQMDKSVLKKNNARGIAFARYKNSAAYCAVGIEISVSDNAEITLINSWISIDAGEIVYPEGIHSQLEGGLIQAASWTIYEQVEYDTRSILSKDWDEYKIIGFNNIPKINVSIIERIGDPFLGVGEVVAGPVSAAIANALFDLLGVRFKNLPFSKDKIKSELLK